MTRGKPNRLNRSVAPLPKPDHRVPRLLSTAFAATLLPSVVLADALDGGSRISTGGRVGVGVGVSANDGAPPARKARVRRHTPRYGIRRLIRNAPCRGPRGRRRDLYCLWRGGPSYFGRSTVEPVVFR